ncbi:MAG: hypothetical protein PHH54_01405 [Candidatus Nanoarchaeia archaeon]|nr:hypothetical protein [Candidatus Nanoarchaeia archaeon]MDD5740620.1 hypothetical protein [Candidatus Nanoarchaeia archaeon]
MINKKSQGWGMDLIIAIGIFTMGLVAFYIYSINTPGESKENIETSSYEGKILANIILSEGSPENWNTTDVAKIGILSDDKINETKLKNFYSLATGAGYDDTKHKFEISYDYYFFLNENMTIEGTEIDGIGKPLVTRNNGYDDAKNLIKITRYTIYKNKPMTAYFYIWEE